MLDDGADNGELARPQLATAVPGVVNTERNQVAHHRLSWRWRRRINPRMKWVPTAMCSCRLGSDELYRYR